jgi:hypothetical protein
VIERHGPEPWHQDIALIADLSLAIAQVTYAAKDTGVSAWFARKSGGFDLLMARSDPPPEVR